MNSAIRLEARELTVGYGQHPVIRDINLRLRSGEMVGIIGPNGSGKSTLLKALSGLIPAQSGQVFLDGQLLTGLEPRARARRMAYVPTAAQPIFGFSVTDVVSHGRYPHESDSGLVNQEAFISSALTRVNLEHLRDVSVNRLSSGEWQRVLIARALAQNAPVMLLDEPTAHLDVKHQAQVFELLLQLSSAEDKTVLCVCHDLNLSAEYCGRLILLSEGKILTQGAPNEVIHPTVLAAAYGIHPMVWSNPHSGQPVVLPARRLSPRA
ncbi:MAG: ABC transporter ATP-binding protein [Planctomycetota bacterium]